MLGQIRKGFRGGGAQTQPCPAREIPGPEERRRSAVTGSEGDEDGRQCG